MRSAPFSSPSLNVTTSACSTASQSVIVETTESAVEVEVGGYGEGAPVLEELGAREQQVETELAGLAQPLDPVAAGRSRCRG
jgi:hypothetical protein